MHESFERQITRPDSLSLCIINCCSLFASVVSFERMRPQQQYSDKYKATARSHNSVIRVVNSLESKTSAGYDSISMQLIKSIIPFIAQPLSELINESFVTGSFPNELKIARVCPVFKGGDAADFSNYRPISILPSFSKIYERLVYNRLMSFIDKHDLLYHNQFGFRKNMILAWQS